MEQLPFPPDVRVGNLRDDHRRTVVRQALSPGPPTLAEVKPFVCSAAIIAVAISVGRFAYTPLLPIMRGDAGLSLTMAGILASVNLAGYLAGALVGTHPAIKTNPQRTIVAASIAIVVLTAAMALPSWAWLPARFLTGVASGIVFVGIVSLVLSVAAERGSTRGPGVFFSGVGLGIAIVGALVPAFAALGGSRGSWLLLALAAAVTLALAIPGLPHAGAAAATAAEPVPRERLLEPRFLALGFVYSIEGAAYIIPATFIVAMIAESGRFAAFSSVTWIVVGLLAAPSATVWTAIAKRTGTAAALGLALVVQAIALLAPLVLPAPYDALVVAFGLGGTFIGITLLANALGRTGQPDGGVTAVAVLTVGYGVGQLVGPLVATRIVVVTGSYRDALLLAGGVLLASVAVFAGQRRLSALRTR
jgi:predicted MFS family arabinose efflux permease